MCVCMCVCMCVYVCVCVYVCMSCCVCVREAKAHVSLQQLRTGTVVCFDAKIGFDDNASFRQKDIFDMRDTAEEVCLSLFVCLFNLFVCCLFVSLFVS